MWVVMLVQVLVAYADGRFWAVPSRQVFSRHLGVCLILGDKTVRGSKHKLRVGHGMIHAHSVWSPSSTTSLTGCWCWWCRGCGCGCYRWGTSSAWARWGCWCRS